MFKTRKQRAEERRKEMERAALEKEYKEKALINKTVRDLKRSLDKYEEQKNILIKLAKEAEMRSLKPQYNMAANGLKIVIQSQDKINAMYLNLTISNQIRMLTKNTKSFVESMSMTAKQLTEIQSDIDFGQAQLDYDQAMAAISETDEKLKDFSDNIFESVSTYTESCEKNDEVDAAIDALIHNASDAMNVPTATDSFEKNDLEIDKKIHELEAMIYGS